MLAGNKNYNFPGGSNVIDRRSSADSAGSATASGGGRSLDDEHNRPRQQRRRQAPEAKKICRVCGDKAYSVNFNVITCESCKAFFRRNALKTKEFRCQTSGNCEVSMETRRSCKKCRLKKCIEVGMIKEWIMSDEARMRKRELIEKNREKRHRLAAAISKSGDNSDCEVYPRSTTESEAAGNTTGYKPFLCTMTAPAIDYAPMSHWQPPPAPLLIQQSSSSPSLLFQHVARSAFQPPTLLPTPTNSLTPIPYHTMLPTQPAATPPATVPPPVEDTIRVPKTLLAALINQCHSESIMCPHQRDCTYSNTMRPSVIVASKSSVPLKCICRCRCGAKAVGALIKDQPPEPPCTTHARVKENKENESDGSDSEAESIENGSCTELALISSEKPCSDFIFNFNIGISGTKLLYLEDLFAAFKYPAKPVGRLFEDEKMVPALPPIDRDEHSAECADRIDKVVRRMVRFCTGIAMSGNINRRVLIDLIKASATELLVMHSILAFSLEFDAWFDMGPNVRPVPGSELNLIKGGVYDPHLQFIRTFPTACKNDVAVILAMSAMVVFNPARVRGGKERRLVQMARDFYLDLLTQYLETKFDADKAKRLRTNLLSHLDICNRMANRIELSVVLELNERDMEPLLIDTLGYSQ